MTGLLLLDQLAEARIEEAIAQGAFDDLPGAGRPLELEDDRLVSEELRAAYRILKHAGLVPPEIEARKEMTALATLIARLDDGPERRRALAKLAFLQARLDARRSRSIRARKRSAR
jgi:hypothetical protein